ncbi:MAG: CaiB/BaiF CoA-transferase family protein [Myxococcales bacterium]
MTGPLAGFRVIEFSGLGPAPFAAMLLSDLGADVLRIERHNLVSQGDKSKPSRDLLNRGRRSVGLNLKSAQGVEVALRLLERADALLEGFRPGVMERLGLGPEVCSARNPQLVYGRMTGWGQSGPWAERAGHDINYIALAGALDPIGRAGEKPMPPMNLVADFGGGGMLLACGVMAALLERSKSGRGQVVDAAMVDGSALLCTMMHAFQHMGMWNGPRGTNLLDTGAHFYEVYETSDGKHMAVGAIEPQFYAEFLRIMGLSDDPRFLAHMDSKRWPELKQILSELFKTKSRDTWSQLFEGSDACVTPVLSAREAAAHPHNSARGTFVTTEALQAAPAPRFSRTPGAVQRPPAVPGAHTDEALLDWGFEADELAQLRARQAIA